MGIIIGIIFGCVLFVVFGLGGEPFFGIGNGWIFGSIYGVLEFGGKTYIQHYALRWVLARNGVLPYPWPWQDKQLTAFLDAMGDRILLRRVGGGWVFIHRYLLEYFASKDAQS